MIPALRFGQKPEQNKLGGNMKNLSSKVGQLFLAAMAVSAVAAPVAFADDAPTEVNVTSTLFTPTGFDDNDEVTVVLDGYLPDPCHRLTEPQVVKADGAKMISVQARALLFPGVCPDVIVPFTQVVKLGRLEKGNYVVRTVDGRQTSRMPVEPAQYPYPDDYLYAPVDRATVEIKGHDYTAILEGRLTNTCLKLRTPLVKPTGKTVQVLPIMDLVDGPTFNCKRTEAPFRLEVKLPEPPKAGRYLLHVRSLNGQGINEVFERPRR